VKHQKSKVNTFCFKIINLMEILLFFEREKKEGETTQEEKMMIPFFWKRKLKVASLIPSCRNVSFFITKCCGSLFL
jgi:hypothetical protein